MIGIEDGIAVVVLARDAELPPAYVSHPQVMPLPVAEVPQTMPALSAKLPSNTRAVIISGELPQFVFGLITKIAQRRNLKYIHRRNTVAVADALRELVPARSPVVAAPEPEPAPEAAPAETMNGTAASPSRSAHGSLKAFVKAEADLTKSNAEEARRLLTVAQGRGISTTFGSLTQCITMLRREGGRTGVPRSVQSSKQRALGTLDEAIAGLQLIREYVEQTEKDNQDLRAKVEAFRKVLMAD